MLGRGQQGVLPAECHVLQLSFFTMDRFESLDSISGIFMSFFLFTRIWFGSVLTITTLLWVMVASSTFLGFYLTKVRIQTAFCLDITCLENCTPIWFLIINYYLHSFVCCGTNKRNFYLNVEQTWRLIHTCIYSQCMQSCGWLFLWNVSSDSWVNLITLLQTTGNK